MGLYDRDYSRPEPSAFGGSYAFGQSMVTTIIVINCALYLANLFFTPGTNAITLLLAADAYSLVRPWMWWQLLTCGFVHDWNGLGHIASNMLGLFFLGRYVEQFLGRWEFLRFYLISIVFGAVVHAARICLTLSPTPLLQDGDPWSIPMLGASGAVVATVILFILRFPRVQLLLFFVIPVPAWLVGVLLVGYNVLGSGGVFLPTSGSNAANIAFDVHLAGAAFALAYFYFGVNFGNWLPSQWGGIASSAAGVLRKRPNLRVHQPAEPELDEEQYRDLDEEADRILAKLGTQGENSLTPAERRVLEDYSRRMRQKHR